MYTHIRMASSSHMLFLQWNRWWEATNRSMSQRTVINGRRGKRGKDGERKWEDRRINGQMNRYREKRKENTGVDENKVGLTIGSASFKVAVTWFCRVKRTVPNVSHPLKASKWVPGKVFYICRETVGPMCFMPINGMKTLEAEKNDCLCLRDIEWSNPY